MKTIRNLLIFYPLLSYGAGTWISHLTPASNIVAREQGVSLEPTRSVSVCVVAASHQQESGGHWPRGGHSRRSDMSGHQVAYLSGILYCV